MDSCSVVRLVMYLERVDLVAEKVIIATMGMTPPTCPWC